MLSKNVQATLLKLKVINTSANIIVFLFIPVKNVRFVERDVVKPITTRYGRKPIGEK